MKEYFKKYHLEHREHNLQKMRERYLKNKESVLANAAIRYKRIKDDLKLKRQENIEEVRKKEREQKKKDYSRNIALSRNKAKEKWANNEGYRAYMKDYRSSPEMRLHSNLSRSIRTALKQKKDGRRWESIVGYSRETLKTHLEKLFKDGMIWDNYGKWEVDHIKPRSSFGLSDDTQVKECWRLENLQPLWMSENRSKYNKIEGEICT
uniref:Putative HNH endonuclease n=1 Tax=viral metagenome TaxID=1070528 RepID=A0A6M3JIP0_9ZZZZ